MINSLILNKFIVNRFLCKLKRILKNALPRNINLDRCLLRLFVSLHKLLPHAHEYVLRNKVGATKYRIFPEISRQCPVIY